MALGFFEVDPEVQKNTLAALEVFRSLGATVEEVDLGWTHEALDGGWPTSITSSGHPCPHSLKSMAMR